jgi:beta-lactamase regulating signal transducer with metallopeptidase domain
MNGEWLSLALPVAKWLLASVLLWLFYRWVLSAKASYRERRYFLVALPWLALCVSVFHVVVYTPPTRLVEWSPNASGMLSPGKSLATASPLEAAPMPSLLSVPLPTVLALIYALVVCFLFVVLWQQYGRIRRLQRQGSLEVSQGYTLIRHPEVPTPFSFGRCIFVAPTLTGDKLQLVLQHESWHIRHAHHRDVILMEVVVRLLWFNPVVWLVRKELRSIHEFEADRSVLKDGYDMYRYQTLILEEVMGNHSFLANGFNQSFTKKRFITMKNQSENRLSSGRKAAVLVFSVALFGVFCLAQGTPKTEYRTAKVIQRSDTTYTKEGAQVVRSVSYTTNGNGPQTKTKITQVTPVNAPAALKQMREGVSGAVKSLNAITDYSSVEQKRKAMQQLMGTMSTSPASTSTEGITLSDQFLNSLNKADFQTTEKQLQQLQNALQALPANATAGDIQSVSPLMMPMLQSGLFAKLLGEMMSQATTMLSKTISTALPQMQSMGKGLNDALKGVETVVADSVRMH